MLTRILQSHVYHYVYIENPNSGSNTSFCFVESNIAEVGEVVQITCFLQASISFYTLM